MAAEVPSMHDLSARRIIGFACNQAFVFYLLFMSPALEPILAEVPLARLELMCVLLFQVAGFGVVELFGPRWFDRIFSRPLLYMYAVIAAVGSLLGIVAPDGGVLVAVTQGLLAGVPSALLLTAWGRAFGGVQSQVAVPEVFLGSLVGALVCLVFSYAPMSGAVFVAVRVLPLASVVNIDTGLRAGVGDAGGRAGVGGVGAGPGYAAGFVEGRDDERARALSFKILAGTLLFGMSSGLMVVHRSVSGVEVTGYYQVSLVLFGAFLIGGLSLLLSDGFGRGAALNKSYRLAVFVLVAGALLAPWPSMAASVLPGEAVVLAGFLGLQVVLISLFIVLAEITGSDCALSFSSGFTSLFAGGLVGAIIAFAIDNSFPDPSTAYAVVALAGAIALLSYMFLFTEGDFDALSQLVTDSDTFEQTCSRIVENYGLSNREAEILSFALRGRTSERIAQELVISKSTVDTHLRRIYSKTGVHSRQELIDLIM